MAELDKQISVMQAKIMEQRKKMGGVNAARENNQQAGPVCDNCQCPACNNCRRPVAWVQGTTGTAAQVPRVSSRNRHPLQGVLVGMTASHSTDKWAQVTADTGTRGQALLGDSEAD